VLAAYRDQPDDFYLLRVGHAGSMGPLANITEDGFGPAAFHSFPSTLEIDGYAGDYGSGFYGYAVNAATFIHHHPWFGWTAFSGNIAQEGEWIRTEITTAGKNRLFIAPESLNMETVAGRMKQVDYNPHTGEVILLLEGETLLDITLPDAKRMILPPGITKNERGYYEVVPSRGKTTSLSMKIAGK